MKALLATLSMSLCLLLAACGGGGDDGRPTPDIGRPTSPASTTCPHVQTSDVWLDNRLGCATVGQKIIDMAAGATGTPGDVAYVIRQVAYDRSMNDLLPDAKARHFQHFLCVRNVPLGVDRQLLAADLEAVMGLASGSLPRDVAISTLANAGTNRAGYAVQACDPQKHPVIVDYSTGLVQSVNPQALPTLVTYDA